MPVSREASARRRRQGQMSAAEVLPMLCVMDTVSAVPWRYHCESDLCQAVNLELPAPGAVSVNASRYPRLA